MAPTPPHGTALSVFDGRDPNGTWELFVLDPPSGAAGAITEGWTLDFELDASAAAPATGGDGETGQAVQPTGSGGLVFSNAGPIQIPADGSATPYPSTIDVSGAEGVLTDVDVTLHGFQHDFPPSLDLLLVAPGGQSVLLMEGVGGSQPVDDLTLTFDDAGSALSERQPVGSGTFRPSSNAGDGFGYNGPTPSAPPPHGSSLGLLSGSDPNGTWELFAFDDSGEATGEIAGGWSLALEVGVGGSGDVVFSDDFSLTDSGWDVFDESGTFGLYRDGTYVLGVQGGFQVAWVLNTSTPELSDLADVRVEATARFLGNPDALAGVICRAAAPDTYYYFLIQGDGTFFIGENGGGGGDNFVSSFTPAIVRGEAPNRIAGECVGGSEGVRLRMFVNGVPVDTVVDAVDPILAGAIGVRAESRAEPIEAAFDDYVVTRAG
jgi:subtilisin-like proprotein convertase family protein